MFSWFTGHVLHRTFWSYMQAEFPYCIRIHCSLVQFQMMSALCTQDLSLQGLSRSLETWTIDKYTVLAALLSQDTSAWLPCRLCAAWIAQILSVFLVISPACSQHGAVWRCAIKFRLDSKMRVLWGCLCHLRQPSQGLILGS